MRRLFALLLVVTLAGLARAGDPPSVTIERRQGEPLRGKLLEFSRGTFRVLVGGTVVEVREEDVREVRIEAPEPAVRARHREAVVRDVSVQPGRVQFSVAPSPENAHVLATFEVWRRPEGGAWERRETLTWGGGQLVDASAPSDAPVEYRVVSVATIDADDPVVRKYGLTLPEAEARRETVIGPLRVEPGERLVPIMATEEDGAVVGVLRHEGAGWTRRQAVLAVGEEWRGHTLTFAGAVDSPDGPRLVLRFTREDGSTFEVTDQDPLPVDTRFPRGVVTAGKDDPGRDAALREALASQRLVTLTLKDAPFTQVIERLRELTGQDVVASPAIDVEELRLTLDVRDVPLAELLTLIEDLSGVGISPWCGVLWLSPGGEPSPWTPPAAKGPAGALLESARVSLDLRDLPLLDALELLRARTGLNIVVTARATDHVQNEARQATLRARDLSLRQALTLLLDGAETLRWHARGRVLMVLLWDERPTREVLAERVLERLLTGADLGPLVASADASGGWEAVGRDWDAHFRGPPTVETVLAELKLLQDDGTWWLADQPPQRRDTPPAASHAGAWTTELWNPDAKLFAVLVERRTLVPITDVATLATMDADLLVTVERNQAATIAPMTSRALGLDLGDRPARVAPKASDLSALLADPSKIAWTTRPLPLLSGDLLVRSNAGKVYVLSMSTPWKGTFTPVASAAWEDARPAPPTAGEPFRVVIQAEGAMTLAHVSLDLRTSRAGGIPGYRLDMDLLVDVTQVDVRAMQRRFGSQPGPQLARGSAAVAPPGAEYDAIASVPAGVSWQSGLVLGDLPHPWTFLVRSGRGRIYKARLSRSGNALLLDAQQLGVDAAGELVARALAAAEEDQGLHVVERLLREAHAAGPERLEPLLLLASTLGDQRRDREALLVLEQAAALVPSDRDVLFLRASTHERLGDLDAAIADLEALLRPLGEPHMEVEAEEKLEELRRRRGAGR